MLDFAAATDQVLLLTTPEATAIADAYALLKILLQRRPALTTGLLVNMAESAKEAAELQEKFAELANRFLGAQIHNWGYIPYRSICTRSRQAPDPFHAGHPAAAGSPGSGPAGGKPGGRAADHSAARAFCPSLAAISLIRLPKTGPYLGGETA